MNCRPEISVVELLRGDWATFLTGLRVQRALIQLRDDELPAEYAKVLVDQFEEIVDRCEEAVYPYGESKDVGLHLVGECFGFMVRALDELVTPELRFLYMVRAIDYANFYQIWYQEQKKRDDDL